jgi:hypothetical protein
MTIEKYVQRNRMPIIFIVFILIAGCFANASETNNMCVIETLNSIPTEHKEEINKLFEHLFKYQAFAYSLYGDKPITLSDTVLCECSSAKLSNSLPLDKYCLDVFRNLLRT